MKAVHTVGLRRFVPGATDSHGKPKKEWADAVDLEVFSIAPRFSNEPDPARPGGIVVGLNLLAPAGTSVGGRDRVVIDGEEYEADGDSADWTRGPFEWAPGVSINLKRAEG